MYVLSYRNGVVVRLAALSEDAAVREATDRCHAIDRSGYVVEMATLRIVASIQPSFGVYYANVYPAPRGDVHE